MNQPQGCRMMASGLWNLDWTTFEQKLFSH